MNNKRWVALGVAVFGAAAIYGLVHMPVWLAADGHYYSTSEGCTGQSDGLRVMLGPLFNRASWRYLITGGDAPGGQLSLCHPVPLYRYLRPEECEPANSGMVGPVTVELE